MIRHLSASQPETTDPGVATLSRPRRAATALEYLFMVSLILVVVLIGVGYFGQQTKKIADDNSTAIQNATKPPPRSGP